MNHFQSHFKIDQVGFKIGATNTKVEMLIPLKQTLGELNGTPLDIYRPCEYKRKNQTISNQTQGDLSAIIKTVFEPEVRAQDSIITS